MLTVDEIRTVPLFSELGQAELDLLTRTSAHVRLAAGEFAAHEGSEERVLCAVLAGKVEVVRQFDGIERTLGWRPAGSISDHGATRYVGRAREFLRRTAPPPRLRIGEAAWATGF